MPGFIQDSKEAGVDSNLIGQFGVGFYSAFLVSDKVNIDALLSFICSNIADQIINANLCLSFKYCKYAECFLGGDMRICQNLLLCLCHMSDR